MNWKLWVLTFRWKKECGWHEENRHKLFPLYTNDPDKWPHGSRLPGNGDRHADNVENSETGPLSYPLAWNAVKTSSPHEISRHDATETISQITRIVKPDARVESDEIIAPGSKDRSRLQESSCDPSEYVIYQLLLPYNIHERPVAPFVLHRVTRNAFMIVMSCPKSDLKTGQVHEEKKSSMQGTWIAFEFHCVTLQSAFQSQQTKLPFIKYYYRKLYTLFISTWCG